jgi:hypothetical protein
MIVDCAKRDDENKAVWLLVMIFGLLLGWGWIAAIVYYFVSRGSDSGNKRVKHKIQRFRVNHQYLIKK